MLSVSAFAADESPYNKGVEAWRKQDYAEARVQWELSLAQGGPDEALNNLAFLLYHGLGGESNPDKAVELWRKGAALAVSEAQLHLGQAYASGKGVPRNLATAYAWYRCAIATAGKLSKDDKTEAEIEKDAVEMIEKLIPKLSESELKSGESQASILIAKYAERLTIKP